MLSKRASIKSGKLANLEIRFSILNMDLFVQKGSLRCTRVGTVHPNELRLLQFDTRLAAECES